MGNATTRVLDIGVQQNGRVPDGEPAHARALVGKLLDHTTEPILYARIRLTVIDDPARPRPALAQANIDLNGRLVRAHAAAASMHEAIELMGERLMIRLGRVARDWESNRGRHHPHDPVSAKRPERAGEPEIIRHKAYTLGRLTAIDAVREMETLDYDFHLFTEATTGGDAVVRRSGGGYMLHLSGPADEDLHLTATSITLATEAAKVMTLAEATATLDLSGAAFLFFTDPGTGRGAVLYYRHDGNLGLIVPHQG
jgi:hypothetical protein